MFENYSSMSADEKAEVKAIHQAIRTRGVGDRYHNLSWGFVRGFPYRRIERTVREGNEPDARLVTHMLAVAIPGFAKLGKQWWDTAPHPEVESWLKNPAGAIPAPVRVKKPYVRPTAEVA